jgi:hypothetical protein
METPDLLKRAVLPAIVLIAGVAVMFQLRNRNRKIEEMIRESEDGGMTPDTRSPEEKEVRALLMKDTATGLLRARELFAAAPAASRDSAADTLVDAMNWHLNRLAREKRWKEAEALAQEAEDTFRGDARAATARRNWLQHAPAAGQATAEAGDETGAARIWAGALDAAWIEFHGGIVVAYQKYAVKRSAKAQGGERARWLEEAASCHVEPRGWNDFVESAMKEPADALLARSEASLAARRPAAALGWLNAAEQSATRAGGRDSAESAIRKRPAALLALCREIDAGRVRTVVREGLDRFWRDAADGSDPEVVLETCEGALRARLDTGLAWARAGQFDRADDRFRDVRHSDLRAWVRAQAEAGRTPAGVPPEIEAKARAAARPEDPKSYARELARLADRGEWTPDHRKFDEVREVLPDMFARWGEFLIRSGYTDVALEKFRFAIRHDPGAEPARRGVAALRAAIREAADKSDLSRLFAFAPFYVAEVGVDAGDAFGGELLPAILRAANGFRESSPMKRILLLSLVCDAFPAASEAGPAAAEVLSVGLEAVRGAPEQQAPHLELPSGLRDAAAVSVENATSQHILVFYDGPEKFFVRFNPYRKGTVILKTGSYLVGVVGTDDSTRPYHGKLTYGAATSFSQYVVVREGGGAEPETLGVASATGDYRIVRPLAGVNAVVDPKLGLASQR